MCPLGPEISLVDRHHTELTVPLHTVFPMVRPIERSQGRPAADPGSGGGGQGSERMLERRRFHEIEMGSNGPGAGIIMPESW